jgi:serine phosphatase RsbU (regulator of sigma subunit)
MAHAPEVKKPAAKSDQECTYCWPLEYMKKETFKRGASLFKAGDPAEKMFYIHKGALRLVELNKIVGAGQFIGEMGIFSPLKTRTASAVCEEDLETYTMGRDEIINFFSRDPNLAITLIQISIKRFIENLKVETEARERIASELRIASEIQMSMLPKVFPQRQEFELYAMMDPAKEVGGDFYDFFFVNEKTLCCVIGDVSGKGVPAALFMAITKTVLKTEALLGLSAEEIIARVNAILCPDNQTCLFVTIFCALIDIETGKVEFCNAGHNPPLVCDASGCSEYLKIPSGFVVGVMENTKCENRKLVLKPDDLLFFYTDGVTEAMNPQHEMFTENKLKNSLTQVRDRDLQTLVHDLREEIKIFAQDEPQSDDITMLALRYKGKG